MFPPPPSADLPDRELARRDVHAVIVTHQPDPPTLDRLLAAVASQVASVVVVDNGSQRPPMLPPLDATSPAAPCRLVALPANLGIGAAQNRGIAIVRELGARYVMLLDQDSTPEPDMVARLLQACREAGAAGCRVAAVGPRIVDAAGDGEGFVRFRTGRYEAVPIAESQRWIDCDLLIASGKLIPLAVLDEIGGMDEGLFIDKVDTEWCLRAAAHGWRPIGAPRALLKHRLGERSVRVWFGRWRELRVHKPFRYYYMVRNGLLLRRSPHRTPAWCRADRRQLLSLFLYFGLLPARGDALRMMLRGLLDGWRQVSGPLR